ncbi:MAG: DUF4258 domain-containing protein [Nitrospirae bacterium]|nr:DUF4258 domain-containing protein [Nitrospirota bacterium]
MNFEIIGRQTIEKGVILNISINNSHIKILFVNYVYGRIKKWNIKEEMVVETLLYPDEVIIGHRERYIAHKIYYNRLIRAVYEYIGGFPVLITVYVPKIGRFYKGGGQFEDQIFKRS